MFYSRYTQNVLKQNETQENVLGVKLILKKIYFLEIKLNYKYAVL